MIKKILIANRDEIAVRIMRACAEIDIRSVTVYSEADRHALHIKRADEAYGVDTDPLAGYLNPRALVNLMVEGGYDALHPGHGFLSENTELAEICAERGTKFVDPSAQVICRMGDRTEARRSMIAAGVPCTPGAEGNVVDLAEALREAERIGYPVMLRATFGDGGRDIRRCNSHRELEQAFSQVTSEVVRASDSAEVFLEKCIVSPKHIKAQILADPFGNAVHLFERDCSIQRHSRKLIEVAPSPQLAPEQRVYIDDPAVHAAKAMGYRNVGTVEFLLTDGEVYFMEMNTRVQVEHTITEEITSIDVVRKQIRIASRLELSVKQDDIIHRGYVLQSHINAENPKNNFLPSFDRVTCYYAPSGPGVRTDTTIYTGYTIPPCYDSMCLKLIVWALAWEEALGRELRVLNGICVQRVETTVSHYQEILRNPEFRSGQFNTSFVEGHPELTQYLIKRNPSHLAIAIATAIAAHASL